MSDSRRRLIITLTALGAEDLRNFAEQLNLSPHGAKKTVAARIAEHYKSLEEFLRETGDIEGWNDFVDRRFSGARKRSYAAIADEMFYCVTTGIPGMRTQLVDEMNNPTVADVRSTPALCRDVARLLGVEVSYLRARLESEHGGKRISNLLEQLVTPSTIGPETRGIPTTLVETRARTQPPPGIGSVLSSRYEIIDQLGSGGFGTVYLARDRRTSLEKVLKLSQSPLQLENLEREFRFGVKLSHPNLCRYLHLEDDPAYGTYVLLEHGGRSLHARFRTEAADVDSAVQIALQAARGLDYLHEQDIVHADISPGNILLDDHGIVRITDFGISANLTRSRTAQATTSATTKRATAATRVATSVLGINPKFSAHEIHQHLKPRPASDQASLAMSICAILQGVDRWVARPKYKFSALSKRQSEALSRAMAHDPKKRFPRCGDFANDFSGV